MTFGAEMSCHLFNSCRPSTSQTGRNRLNRDDHDGVTVGMSKCLIHYRCLPKEILAPVLCLVTRDGLAFLPWIFV